MQKRTRDEDEELEEPAEKNLQEPQVTNEKTKVPFENQQKVQHNHYRMTIST